MDDDTRRRFEEPPPDDVYPALGSRGDATNRDEIRLSADLVDGAGSQRYRYLAATGDAVIVWVGMSEYLAAEVIWSAPNL